MKQLLLLLALALPCLLLFSCDYSPSGEHYEEVEPNPTVTADLSLYPDKDTLYVRGNTVFNFSISLPGRNMHGYELRLNDKLLAEGIQSSGSHYFNSEKYANGFYTLKLSVISNSGTGSLADRVGAEVLEVYRTWKVYIENGPPQSVAVTSIKPENGSLRIDWQKYTGNFFQKYELYTYSPNGSSRLVTTVTDPRITHAYDTAYTGGATKYWVQVWVANSSNATYFDTYSTGPPTSYNYPLPRVLQHSYDEQHRLKITFSSTPFYKNFDSYTLSAGSDFTYTTTSWADTVVTLEDPGFGADFNVKLVTFPKGVIKEHYANQRFTENNVTGYGTAWGPYLLNSRWINAPANLFYTQEQNKLEVVDAQTLQKTHTRNTGYEYSTPGFSQFTVSANGQHVYAILDHKVHQLDPVTLATKASFSATELLGNNGPYSILSIDGCSNNNRLAIGATKGYPYKDSVYVVDMVEQKVLSRQLSTTYGVVSDLSPDGKALRVYGKLYTEQPDGAWVLQEVWDKGNTLHLAFHPDKPWYALQKGTSMGFYAIADGSLKASITTEVALENYSVDPASGLLYGFADRMLYVYDIQTGEQVRKLKIANNGYGLLYRDKIFSRNRYIPL